MTKQDVREKIIAHECAFAQWYRAADEFARNPPAELTNWWDLPNFPRVYLGYAVAKTTVRIPHAFQSRKMEFLLLLAERLYAQAYTLYGDTIRIGYNEQSDREIHRLGIAKHAGNHVSVYWYCLSVEGNLVQVECVYGIYSNGMPLQMPAMAIAHYPKGVLPAKGIAHHPDDALVDELLCRYFPPDQILKATYFSWPWLLYMIYRPSVFTGCFIVIFVILLFIGLSVVCVRPALGLALFVVLTLILSVSSYVWTSQSLLDQFKQDDTWDLSLNYYRCLARTKEALDTCISKSLDHQIFIARMKDILQQVQSYLESIADNPRGK